MLSGVMWERNVIDTNNIFNTTTPGFATKRLTVPANTPTTTLHLHQASEYERVVSRCTGRDSVTGSNLEMFAFWSHYQRGDETCVPASC